MTRYSFWTVAAVLAATNSATAQPDTASERAPATITGTIRDQATGRPVPGVSVYLVDTAQMAITGDDGRFELSPPKQGTWRLAIVDPAFERADAQVKVGAQGSDAHVDLVLSSRSLRGEEVVVEADKQRDVAGATTLRREEITRVPGSRGDALTAIKSLPGIANNGFFGGVMIRGSSPADSRFFVDGFEVPAIYHFGGIQSVLPSEMISDMAYSPGGYGVELGRATGGTIEVSTRAGDRDYGGFAEMSFINASALAKGPIGDKATFAVAARRSYIDAILPLVVPSDDSLSFTALPRYYDYQARVDYAPTDDWKLSLLLIGSDDLVELQNNEDNAEDPLATGRFRNHTYFHRAIGNARYDSGRLSNRFGFAGGFDQDAFEVGADRFLDADVVTLTARDDARFRLSDNVALIFGGEVDIDDQNVQIKLPRPPKEGDPADPNFTFDPIVDEQILATSTNVGGWAAVEARPLGWLKTTAGVRVDAFTRNSITVAQPRLNARAQLAKNTALVGGVGLYTRPPDDQDENLQIDLGPERAIHSSLGVEQTVVPGLTVQLTGYYVDRSDLIVFDENRLDAPQMDAAGTYVNEGTGTAYGAEALIRLRRGNAFGWLSYTLARSEQVDHPGDSARLFDFDQTHNLVIVGSYKLGKWQLGGRFQYTSATPFTPVVGAVFMSDQNIYRPEYGAVNSERSDAQHQLDVRIDRAFELDSWKLSAYLDITNVYLNAPVVSYQYNFDYTEREEISGIPIMPAIGLRGEL